MDYVRVSTKTGDKVHLAETGKDTTNGNTLCGHEWHIIVPRGAPLDPTVLCEVCQSANA